MKTRTLLDGSTVKELSESVILQVITKCPAKYKLIDMQTGQQYTGYETQGKYSWKPLNENLNWPYIDEK